MKISREILFSKEKYGFILDHVPENGAPVVPFVSVADSLINVFENKIAIKDLSLKIGLTWPFTNSLKWNIDNGKAVLTDTNNKIYYTAEITDVCEKVEKNKSEVGDFLPPDYKLLFHGPKLQSIKNYKEISENIYQAELLSSIELGWSFTDWHLDQALADGILQLACMVCNIKMKKPSLPVKIGRVCAFSTNVTKYNWCQLEIVRLNKLGYVFNGYCYNDKNELLFYLENVNAFFRNV